MIQIFESLPPCCDDNDQPENVSDGKLVVRQIITKSPILRGPEIRFRHDPEKHQVNDDVDICGRGSNCFERAPRVTAAGVPAHPLPSWSRSGESGKAGGGKCGVEG